ncbi:hypothetical protein [Tenacibaculum sp. SDUM215027]|uniref:hypothetical protein n=1 Tax=Tenacibaculum sp. SDUM215027 TaxID=3422596 RepID=UPI003D313BE0
MKEINLESDLNLICVRAKSFPQGIEDSFKTLERKVPTRKGRECYGIYEENENGITYRAGMLKKTDDEDAKYGLENYIVKKGKYLGVTINNWKSNIPKIGQTFDKMVEDERVEKNSPSIEVYKGLNDVICMVKMKS